MGHGSTVHDQGLEHAPPPMRMRAHDVIATDRDRSNSRDRSIGSIDKVECSIDKVDRSISIDRASLADAAHSIRAHGDDACGACGATGRTHEAGGDVATGEHRVASGCRRHKPSERRQKPSEFIHSFIHSLIVARDLISDGRTTTTDEDGDGDGGGCVGGVMS